MAKYAKNQIGEDFYLKRMGAMSLKLARVAHKTTTTVQAQNVPGLVPDDLPGLVPDDDVESNDSLSETRPMPQSDETDSFSDNDHQYGNDALTGGADRLLNIQVGNRRQKRKFYHFCTLLN